MAKVLFQAKVTLNNATDLGSNTWSLDVTFADALGVFTAGSAQVGDIIVFDTAPAGEFGTYTRYIIQSIDNVAGSAITCTVQYDPTNNNDTPPDLTWIIGLGDGLITRPTATYGLLPTPATGVHSITDDFAEYVSNMNLESIDGITGGGGSVDLTGYATETYVDNAVFSGDYNDLTNTPIIPSVPTTVSSFTNDSGYITDYTVTEADVLAHRAALVIPDNLNDFVADGTAGQILTTNGAGSFTFEDAPQGFDGQYTSLTGAPTAVSAFTNDAGYITGYTETDPIFTAWDRSTGITITESQITDLQAYLTSETTTSLVLAGNTLTFTDETGTPNDIDLSAYLDEDSRSIASGVLDGVTGIVTFTRDDASTFTLDLSALLDDTNLVTSVAGKAGVVTLEKADITDLTSAGPSTEGLIVGYTPEDGSANIGLGGSALANVAYSDDGQGTILGYRNIAIGRGAGDAITTGSGNVAIGRDALTSNITADSNVAIGTGAANRVNSDGNVFVGPNAGWGMRNATNNIAIGRNVMAQWSQVQDGAGAIEANIFLGREVGVSITGFDPADGVTPMNTDYNVALGELALSDFVAGSSNVALGGSAINLTSGSNNVFLGASAGNRIDDGNNLLTANNTIIIGRDATASADGAANEITLGRPDQTRFRVPGVGLDIDAPSLDNGDLLRWNGSNFVAEQLSETSVGYAVANQVWSPNTDGDKIGAGVFTDGWHDILAFGGAASNVITQELFDGATWNADTLDEGLFAHRYNRVNTVADGVTNTAARWTISGSFMSYCSVSKMIITWGFPTNSPAHDVLVETSGDAGVTWSTRHTSTGTTYRDKIAVYEVNYWGADNLVRITVTSTNGEAIMVRNLQLMTGRTGSQGLGNEYQYPYEWDDDASLKPRNRILAPNTQSLSQPVYAFEDDRNTGITQTASSEFSLVVDSVEVAKVTNGSKGLKNSAGSPYVTENADTTFTGNITVNGNFRSSTTNGTWLGEMFFDTSKETAASGTIGRNKSYFANSVLGAGLLNPNPESSQYMHNPMVANDIAFMIDKGATWTFSGDNTGWSDAYVTRAIDGSGRYIGIAGTDFVDANTEVTIELDWSGVTTPLLYSTTVGAIFTGSGFAPEYCRVEAFSEGAWVQVIENTALSSSGREMAIGKVTGNSGVGTTAVRIVMKNDTQSEVRLAHIYGVDYNSSGAETISMTRSGGDIYGDVDVQGTLSVNGAPIASTMLPWAQRFSSFTADLGGQYLIDTGTAALTMTLPASPVPGSEVRFLDSGGDAATNNITIDGNGNNIYTDPTLVINTAYAGNSLVWTGGRWILSNN